MNGNMNYDMDNDNDIDSECWFLVQCVVLITITSGKKQEWGHDMNNNLIDVMMNSCNEW